ncbi:hypothetical protein F383_05586 [Gossypium arboreum]|uniref:Uncharacterized protein n=7 Tax=Gossypium TaxID=3633 RepID=A0A0B0MVD6_GOSAR|nr:uncharacterized protein LOC107935980 isoform X2 [Gossypium hirsutum]XP_017633186.1 uncharacterized protein LOC108475713 isoform X2 [Gossypium arboreum]KAB2092028.1 hypothetical protein ES319_A02G000700v1 [Gossypium barbadense]TYI38067.1 hypothetical protein ES332_A02G001100v1 [Gossypium tomentosum]TYJ44678.1 hypothetical protein E1A91_A02G000800v1 [Gossypium mustelinum]KAG4209744.1 hypothetical protein ERO13_A02G000800v2 [Gossypium hirsutum]KAK5841359.1 hypothetical protein PVK06_010269 [G
MHERCEQNMDSWAIDLRILKISILVLFTACLVKASATASRSNGEYKPVGPTEYRLLQPDLGKDDGARRRLAPFQLCLLCKCCSATAASTCTSMPCCFGIDCQLPNKPFGVCAFVPKTCNCNSCAA